MAAKKETKNIEVKEVKKMDGAKQEVEKMVKEVIEKYQGKLIINGKDVTNKDIRQIKIDTIDKGNQTISPSYCTLELAEKLMWKVLPNGTILAVLFDGRKRSCYWIKDGEPLAANVTASTFNTLYAYMNKVKWEDANNLYKWTIDRKDGRKSTKEAITLEEIFGGK